MLAQINKPQIWTQFVFILGTMNSTRGGMNDSNPCLGNEMGAGRIREHEPIKLASPTYPLLRLNYWLVSFWVIHTLGFH